MKKIFLILVVLGGLLMTTSCWGCNPSCECRNKNTGYMYPNVYYKTEGYKNCKEVEQDMTAKKGVAISCGRDI